MIDSIPTKKDILEASDRIDGYVHHTPVLTSRSIDSILGCHLYFKCENFQKVGAFKVRGAINTGLSLTEEQQRSGLATHSSGNHAQAIAFAANMLNTKAFIVMPRNAPLVKVDAVREYGAEIIFCEPTLNARERELNEVVKRESAYFIHPYNDYNVIAGQSTAALELINDMKSEVLDAIIAPVGGGGLLSGTCLARNYFSPATAVYAAEPEGAGDAYLSVKKGKIVPSEDPATIADGLLTSLGAKTFPVIRDNIREILLVSDEKIILAMKLIWERMKIIIEPSAAVPLAAIMDNPGIFKGRKTGIILSGGNVDLNNLPF